MSLTWSAKKQFKIFLGLLILALGLASFWIVPKLKKNPTCFDGLLNQNEKEIDCGGLCQKMCLSEVNDLSVLWSRTFPASGNIYSSVAYIENQNIESSLEKITYEFKIYDDKNIRIASKQGETFIAPNSRTAVFETGFNVGERTPFKTTFEIVKKSDWLKTKRVFNDIANKILVQDQVISDLGKTPRLSAKIVNESIYNFKNLEVVAILYDQTGNAFATSRTFIDHLDKNSFENIFFTWPNSFKQENIRIEIVPRLNPFSFEY